MLSSPLLRLGSLRFAPSQAKPSYRLGVTLLCEGCGEAFQGFRFQPHVSNLSIRLSVCPSQETGKEKEGERIKEEMMDFEKLLLLIVLKVFSLKKINELLTG